MYVHIINQNCVVFCGATVRSDKSNSSICPESLLFDQWAAYFGLISLCHVCITRPDCFYLYMKLRLNEVRGSITVLQCSSALQKSIRVKVSQVSRVSWDRCVNRSGFHGNYTSVSTFGWQTIGSLIGFAPKYSELPTETCPKMHCDTLSEKSIYNCDSSSRNAEKCRLLSVCLSAGQLVTTLNSLLNITHSCLVYAI